MIRFSLYLGALLVAPVADRALVGDGEGRGGGENAAFAVVVACVVATGRGLGFRV